MASEAYDYLNQELGGLSRTKAQGQMLERMFGIQSSAIYTERRQDVNQARTPEQTKGLQYMRGMSVSRYHSKL
jgi:hypothetical protein